MGAIRHNDILYGGVPVDQAYDSSSAHAQSGVAVAQAIGALDVSDSAVSGQYVSAVSETDGKISVSRANLPTVPTKVSDLTNDSGYQTASDVSTAISGKEDKSALKDLAYIAKDGASSTKVLQGDGTWVAPSAGHTMIPTPATNLTETSIVSAINTALLEGGINDDVPSNFGIGKWSNTMSKAFLVQGVAGSNTPVGTTGVGTWPADPQNPTSTEKADWMCIPELYGCGSALGINFDLVYDPATVSVPIARGGYVIDDNETMSDGQGGTIPCAKMCIKFANEIPEADTHTAVVGAEITIKRTETVFVG